MLLFTENLILFTDWKDIPTLFSFLQDPRTKRCTMLMKEPGPLTAFKSGLWRRLSKIRDFLWRDWPMNRSGLIIAWLWTFPFVSSLSYQASSTLLTMSATSILRSLREQSITSEINPSASSGHRPVTTHNCKINSVYILASPPFFW